MSLAQPLPQQTSSIKLQALSTLNEQRAIQAAPLRPVRFFSPDVELTHRADGAYLMQSLEPLADYDNRPLGTESSRQNISR